MEIHYSHYLQLEKILEAQKPESATRSSPAHDEMLFIIVHQAYELWFKQILHELDSCLLIMKKPSLNDNSPELQTLVHRLARISAILKLLVSQVDIMETMTPMDFLDFRDLLRPASGFQSLQFKLIESKLGLRFDDRHGKDVVTARLTEQDIQKIKEGEQATSLLDLVNNWLERMPFFEEHKYWQHYGSERPNADEGTVVAGMHLFWQDYRRIYQRGLAEVEQKNLLAFDQVLFDQPLPTQRRFSAAALRAALFIMLYRGYPLLHQPFQLLNFLIEIDEQLSTWRYRHMNMVQRMIGTRIGTGGSSGADYLRTAIDKHYIFKELAALTSFLIERRKLPLLSSEMEHRLGFSAS